MEVCVTNSTVFSCRNIDELASWTYDFNFIPHPSTNPFGHKENHSDDDGRKESLAPELYKSHMEKSKRENVPRMFLGEHGVAQNS
jgi:hypothetical protein